jgi:hypothetical protein
MPRLWRVAGAVASSWAGPRAGELNAYDSRCRHPRGESRPEHAGLLEDRRHMYFSHNSESRGTL